MSMIVFTGPTISSYEVENYLEATVLPPAKQGDIYLATLKKPEAIGIIDGFFNSVPAVWHKEILWAMKMGIHVYGAASMGALRAAELADFGMIGVGQIFENYKNGILTDDDEVALLHGPKELNYKPFSEPLVNIRATLDLAKEQKILSLHNYSLLMNSAKKLFFPQRTYKNIMASLEPNQVPKEERTELQNFIKKHRINQKHKDAQALLMTMAYDKQQGFTKKEITYHFSYTDAWQQMVETVHEKQTSPNIVGQESEVLIEELKLHNRLSELRLLARSRRFGLEIAQKLGLTITPDNLKQTLENFCTNQMFLNHDKSIDFDGLSRWCEEQDLDLDNFNNLMEKEVKLSWVEEVYATNIIADIIDQLRLSGEYNYFTSRINDKMRVLRHYPYESSYSTEEEKVMLQWYFEKWLEQKIPKNLEQYAHEAGFLDLDQFKKIVYKEYYYTHNK